MIQRSVDQYLLEIIEATSFPPAALRICNLVCNSSTNIEQIVNAISVDPVLSAKVLKVANSPFFSRGIHTDTLKHALDLTGIDAVRTIALCAATHDLYKKSESVDRNMWSHSLGVSLIASMLARETRQADEHIAATAGLFHDIGKLVLKNAFPQEYAEMCESLKGNALSFCRAEVRMFGTDHLVMGSLIANKWGLGKEYSIIIALHHANQPLSLAKVEADLLTIVRIANEIALSFGIGFREKTDIFSLPFENLGMTKQRFKDLIWRVNETYEEHINSLSF